MKSKLLNTKKYKYPISILNSINEKEKFDIERIEKCFIDIGMSEEERDLIFKNSLEKINTLLEKQPNNFNTSMIKNIIIFELYFENLDKYVDLYENYEKKKKIKFFLPNDFIDNYRNKQPDWGPIGYVVYKRTYARRLNGKTEEFFETIRRCVEGCYSIQKEHCIRLGLPWYEEKALNSAKTMYKKMWNFKFLPPGRGLWMMGTEFVDKHGSMCLNNCGFVSTDNIDIKGSSPFEWTMDALMLGVGVGFDVRGAGKITIKEPRYINKEFVIPDSRKGWIDAVKFIIDGFFNGSDIPIIKYHEIRVAGLPIKGFGGISSGPGPLKQLVKDIEDLLILYIGKKITSGTIVDMMNMIGKCVVAGNVRRSAEIAIGDIDDYEFINLKNDEKKLKSHRWASNNSIFAKRGMDYSPIVDNIIKNGEPGLVWIDNIRNYSRMNDGPDYKDIKVKGVNPCLTGDTIIAVADGRNGINIKELSEKRKTFPVYSTKKMFYTNQFGVSNKFSHWKLEINNAIAFFSGKKEIIKLILSDGSSFKCTSKHLISTNNGNWIFAKNTKGIELSKFYSFSNKNTNKSYRHINSITNGYARQYRMIWEFNNYKYKGKEMTIDHIDNNTTNDFLDNLKLISKTEHQKLSNNSKKGKNNPINRMDKDYHSWLSKCNIRKSNATKYNWSEDRYKKEMKEFLDNNPKPIIEDNNIFFNEKIFVDNIIYTGEFEDVYDLKVENNENFYIITKTDDDKFLNSSGILVHNCNEQSLESYELCCLVETFPSLHDSYEEYEKTLKMAYLYAKSVTLVNTHWGITNAVMLKNRRIGVSQTGIIDAFVKHGRTEMINWCENGYNYLKKLDNIYSDWLCVPKSIKITSVKPSGTVSLLPGVSPGIHYPHSEYYIRRVRLMENSRLVSVLEKSGYRIEKDKYSSNTIVVSFPIKENFFDRSKKDISIWEQFENAATYQRYWADNQVSITVTFNKNEEKDIIHCLKSYEDKIKGISLLSIDRKIYEQPPYEEIDKEMYEIMKLEIKELNFNKYKEEGEGTKYCDSDNCSLQPHKFKRTEPGNKKVFP